MSNETRVVLYDQVNQANHNEWAARLWWMFRVFGHDNVGVLNGGWPRWTAEDRPVSLTADAPEPATFAPEYRPELVADKKRVRAQIGDEESCLLNALRPTDHAAERIPDSDNIPAVGEDGVLNEDGTYATESELRQQFAAVGATEADAVITAVARRKPTRSRVG